MRYGVQPAGEHLRTDNAYRSADRPGSPYQVNRPTSPSTEILRRALTQLGGEHRSAILERRDGWYVQIGVGARAATQPGWYALERQDGSPTAHYRTVPTESLVRTPASAAGDGSGP